MVSSAVAVPELVEHHDWRIVFKNTLRIAVSGVVTQIMGLYSVFPKDSMVRTLGEAHINGENSFIGVGNLNVAEGVFTL